MKNDSIAVRNSNIELLRILAMCMIVSYHIVCHCILNQLAESGGVFNQAINYRRLLLVESFMPLGSIGNDIFILISGFFMAGRSVIDLSKIAMKLLWQLAFAVMVLLFVPMVILNQQNGFHFYLMGVEAFNQSLWFVGYYFLIIVIGAYFLNPFLKTLTQKQYLEFVMVMFALLSFGWTRGIFSALANGLETVVVGIFFYSLGGYIRQYEPFQKLRLWFLFAVILLTYLLVWVSTYNSTQLCIEEYIKSGNTNEFFQTLIWYGNESIIVILISIALFEMIRRVPSFYSRVINFLGSASFMVYLIHDNSFFYQMWNTTKWPELLFNSPMHYLIKMITWTLCVFGIGVAAYSFYLGMKKVVSVGRIFALKD